MGRYTWPVKGPSLAQQIEPGQDWSREQEKPPHTPRRSALDIISRSATVTTRAPLPRRTTGLSVPIRMEGEP